MRFECRTCRHSGAYAARWQHHKRCPSCAPDAAAALAKQQQSDYFQRATDLETAYHGAPPTSTYRTNTLPCPDPTEHDFAMRFGGGADQWPTSEWGDNPELLREQTGLDADQIAEVWSWVKDLIIPLRVKKFKANSGGQDLLPGPFNLFLMALHRLRRYPTNEYFALKTGLDESTIRDTFESVYTALDTALAPFIQWPRQPQHLRRHTTEPARNAVCAIDTTVMRVRRPEDRDERVRLYSFKTDPHWGYKLQIVVGFDGRIWHCYGPRPAAEADITILRNSGVLDLLSPSNRAIGDTAYRGRDEAAKVITAPVKPPGGELTPAQEADAKIIHSLRACVENVNKCLSNWAFFDAVYRGRSDIPDLFAPALRTIVALTDYQVQSAPVRMLIRRFAHPKPAGS